MTGLSDSGACRKGVPDSNWSFAPRGVGGQAGEEKREGVVQFHSPRTEGSVDGGLGDGIAAGGGDWPKGEEVGQDSNEIKGDEDQRSEEKGTREVFLGFDDFAGAVGAKLPAFVSPQNSDHAQAEVGE